VHGSPSEKELQAMGSTEQEQAEAYNRMKGILQETSKLILIFCFQNALYLQHNRNKAENDLFRI